MENEGETVAAWGLIPACHTDGPIFVELDFGTSRALFYEANNLPETADVRTGMQSHGSGKNR